MADSTRVRRSPFAAGGGGGMQLPPPQAAQPPPPPMVNAGVQNAADNFDFDSWGEPAVPPGQPQPQPVQPPQWGQPQQPVQPQWQQPQPPQQPQQWGQPAQPQGMQPPGQTNQQLMGAVAGAFASSMGVDQGIAGSFANIGLQQAQNQWQQAGMDQVAGWFPTMLRNLQLLFAVGHTFVLKKLLLLMCPFVPKKDSNSSQGWGDSSPGAANSRLGPDGLKVDIEEPDGYIPLMSFITYLIVYSVQRGIVSDFKPEVIYSTFMWALLWLIIEIGAAKLGFYIAASPVPVLEIVMVSCYKYVPVVLMVVFRILTAGSKLYYVFFLYLASCAGWSVWRFMQNLGEDPQRAQYGQPPNALRKHIITGLAIGQVPACWLLTPYA